MLPLRRMAMAPPRPRWGWVASRALSSTPEKSPLLDKVFDPAKRQLAEKVAEQQQKGKSFGHAIRSGAKRLEDDRKENTFRDSLQSMLALDEFSWDFVYAEHKRGLEELEETGMTKRLTRFYDRIANKGEQVKKEEEMKAELRKFIQIMDELTIHEKRCHKLLTLPARMAISRKLGFNGLKEINEIISRYEYMRAQHGWLRRAAARGEPIPKTQEELSWMVQLNPTKEFTRIFRREAIRRMAPGRRNMELKKSTKLPRRFR